ncbi:hypothetical protein D9M72_444460 [compost metagenome]
MGDVFLQFRRIRKLVDIEGVGEPRDIRAEQDATRRENKFSVADRRFPSVVIRIGNGVVRRRDGRRITLDETHACVSKDLGQGRLHLGRMLFVEAGANVELGLRRDHGNLDGSVRLSLLVQ